MSTRRVLHVLQAVFLLFLLSGCAITNKFGPYMGKVIDTETEKPIEGAVVFMKCGSLTSNLGGTQYHYVDAKEVVTDNHGEFHIELRVTTLRPGHLWERPQFTIFKPGYGVFPDYPGSSVDITIKDTSKYFPENQFVTIRIPPLRTREARRRNLDKADDYDNNEIPYTKRKNLFKMTNDESVSIGLKPLPIPTH